MNDKIALVTGANRGIGLEVAKQLLDRGYTIVLTSRKAQDGIEAVKSLNAPADKAFSHQLDVTDPESVRKLKNYIEATFGRLEILINNAGINYDDWQKAQSADLNHVKTTMETNLYGAWRMALAFIPMMKAQSYGRIVNVSSGAGALEGMQGNTPGYGVSKAAMNVLTIKLGKELEGTGILVNSVCPGWVRTDMGGDQAPRSVEEGAKGIVWAAEIEDNGPSGLFFRDGKQIPF